MGLISELPFQQLVPGSDDNAALRTNFIIEQDTSAASLHCLCLADLGRY